MKRRMNVAQTQYFLDRMLAFWTLRRCAEELDASVLTVERWSKGRSSPTLNRLPDFEDALTTLCKELVRKAHGPNRQFWALIADALRDKECPEWTEPPAGNRDTTYLREFLYEALVGRTVKSTSILRDTDEMGYSRPQVYTMAHRLGVNMQNKKLGRGGYSLWSLRERRHRRG